MVKQPKSITLLLKDLFFNIEKKNSSKKLKYPELSQVKLIIITRFKLKYTVKQKIQNYDDNLIIVQQQLKGWFLNYEKIDQMYLNSQEMK